MERRFAAGLLLADRFVLEAQLGEGGMGVVWSAIDRHDGKAVAVKLIKSPDREAWRRFRREARAVSSLEHPNVVRVHEVLVLEGGAPALVMELLVGESLDATFSRLGRIPVGELASVMVPVVSAVVAAHEAGIIHRDLKPENIFLARTDLGTRVKVLDFGIAKLLGTGGLSTTSETATGAMIGTPCYMAPEQALGETTVDHRVDIWSLGILLYHGLTGTLPTRADNIGKVLRILITHDIPSLHEHADVPGELASLVDRMLAAAPAERPELAEVMRVLSAHVGPELVLPAPSSTPASVSVSTPEIRGSSPSQRIHLGHAPTVVAATRDPAPTPTGARTRRYIVGAAVLAAASILAAFLGPWDRTPRAEVETITPGPANPSSPAASESSIAPTVEADAVARPEPTVSAPPPVAASVKAPAPRSAPSAAKSVSPSEPPRPAAPAASPTSSSLQQNVVTKPPF